MGKRGRMGNVPVFALSSNAEFFKLALYRRKGFGGGGKEHELGKEYVNGSSAAEVGNGLT